MNFRPIHIIKQLLIHEWAHVFSKKLCFQCLALKTQIALKDLNMAELLSHSVIKVVVDWICVSFQ